MVKKSIKKSPLFKPMLIMLISIGVLMGMIVAWYIIKQSFMSKIFAKMGSAPQTISTVKADSAVWSQQLNSIGTLKALQAVDISPNVAGVVTGIYFNSGQSVSAGQLLVQLDDRSQQAQLSGSQADMRLANLDYQRQLTLYKRGAIAKSTLDSAKASLDKAQAVVASNQVAVSDKKILAPFSGRLGIRQVSLGQYIQPGPSAGVVDIRETDPLAVEFSLPQQDLPKIVDGQQVIITTDAHPGITFTGKVLAIGSGISVDSRSITIRAEVPNQKGLLYPGMFVNTTLVLPKSDRWVTLPQTAITYSLYGNTVFIVRPDNADKSVLKAHLTTVKLGDVRDNKVAVLSGVKSGDQVVDSGQLKLQNGTVVKVNNKIN